MLQLRELALDQVTTLLLDADGNLFASEEPAFDASVRVTNRFLEQIGSSRRYESDELRIATNGKNFRSTLQDLAVEHGVVLDADQVAEWVAEENRVVTGHLGQTLRPDPAVTASLARLAERFALSVVSSSALARLATCFTVTGLDQLLPVERRFSAQDSLPVPTSKPDPAVYLHAARRLGLRPEQGLAVEDAVAGAQSAVAAGLQTIGNVTFVPVEERSERISALAQVGVSAVVRSWAELEQLVGTGTGPKAMMVR